MDIYTLSLNGNVGGLLELLSKARAEGQSIDVNEEMYGKCCLHLASLRGHPDVVRALLIYGADTSIREANNGETPLHIAAQNNHNEVALLLISRGRIDDINTVDFRYSFTPLHHAVERGHYEMVNTLLDYHLYDIANSKGQGKSKSDSLRPSLKPRCNINSVDKDGFTPLHHACICGFNDVALVLIEKGANLMAISNIGWSILHTAFRRGLQQIVITLINKGISIHQPHDNNGESPIDMAHARIDKEFVMKTYVGYHSGQRKSNKELESIALGKNMCIRQGLKKTERKSKLRTSVWGDEDTFDLSKEDPDMDKSGVAYSKYKDFKDENRAHK